MATEEFHAYQENAFDAFCRAVIRNESIDAHRELATQAGSINRVGGAASPDLSHHRTYRSVYGGSIA